MSGSREKFAETRNVLNQSFRNLSFKVATPRAEITGDESPRTETPRAETPGDESPRTKLRVDGTVNQLRAWLKLATLNVLNNVGGRPNFGEDCRFIPISGTLATNFYADPENLGAETIYNAINAARRQTGQLEYKFINANTVDGETLLRGLKESGALTHIPNNVLAKKLNIDTEGLQIVVNEEASNALESKRNAAVVISDMKMDQYTSIIKIEEYLTSRGVDNREERGALAQKIFADLVKFTPNTGVVTTAEEIDNVLKENLTKGMVFQKDHDAAGRGTIIYTSDEIKELLSKPNRDYNFYINEFAEKLYTVRHKTDEIQQNEVEKANEMFRIEIDKESGKEIPKGIKPELLDEIKAGAGLSWQEFVKSPSKVKENAKHPKEAAYQTSIRPAFVDGKQVKDGKPLMCIVGSSIQYCGDLGQHNGAAIRSAEPGQDFFNTPDDKLIREWLLDVLMNEELKLQYPDEPRGLNNPALVLAISGFDLICPDGEAIDSVFSEQNARSTYTIRHALAPFIARAIAKLLAEKNIDASTLPKDPKLFSSYIYSLLGREIDKETGRPIGSRKGVEKFVNAIEWGDSLDSGYHSVKLEGFNLLKDIGGPDAIGAYIIESVKNHNTSLTGEATYDTSQFALSGNRIEGTNKINLSITVTYPDVAKDQAQRKARLEAVIGMGQEFTHLTKEKATEFLRDHPQLTNLKQIAVNQQQNIALDRSSFVDRLQTAQNSSTISTSERASFTDKKLASGTSSPVAKARTAANRETSRTNSGDSQTQANNVDRNVRVNSGGSHRSLSPTSLQRLAEERSLSKTIKVHQTAK